MVRFSRLVRVALGLAIACPVWLMASSAAQAQSAPDSLCPAPALSRLQRHRITPGETLTSIAQQYGLIPATLMGFNPSLRNGSAPAGSEILIPPYNGIRVEVPAGSSWQDVAAAFGVRPDVLFEVNGCQPVARAVFVPGVNWSPNGPTTAAPRTTTTPSPALGRYPLPNPSEVITGFGWQVDDPSGEVVFHSGVDLQAEAGTPVLAVQAGTVAFAGLQGNYGNLVVINHAQGLQTRYGQLATLEVRMGQTVGAGDRIGTVGQTGDAHGPHLHFEVRSNSSLGWVAESPSGFFPTMEVGR